MSIQYIQCYTTTVEALKRIPGLCDVFLEWRQQQHTNASIWHKYKCPGLIFRFLFRVITMMQNAIANKKQKTQRLMYCRSRCEVRMLELVSRAMSVEIVVGPNAPSDQTSLAHEDDRCWCLNYKRNRGMCKFCCRDAPWPVTILRQQEWRPILKRWLGRNLPLSNDVFNRVLWPLLEPKRRLLSHVPLTEPGNGMMEKGVTFERKSHLCKKCKGSDFVNVGEKRANVLSGSISYK